MNEAVAEVAHAVAISRSTGLRSQWRTTWPGPLVLKSRGVGNAEASGSGFRSAPARRASITAIRAATAANESWKLTPRIASGSSATTAITASARLRIVSARRSSSTAEKTMMVMMSARSVPTREPVAMS